MSTKILQIKKQDRALLIALVIIIVVSIVYLESTKPNLEPLDADMKEGEYPKAPELAGIAGYLNTNGEEIKIADYRGKVVLIDFWTYTCINCIRTLPHLTAWDEKYKDNGLVIIGVHTPEFGFEKKKENVQAAIDKYGIEYAVVQDNDYGTWRAFRNSYWPHKYLIDKDGFIRYDHIGEGGYEETEKEIQKLLAEIGEETEGSASASVKAKAPTFGVGRTPELYAGFEFALPRGQDIGNDGGMEVRKTEKYALPDELTRNQIYLEGSWLSNGDNLESKSAGSIVLDFTAADVNIVADALEEPIKMEVFVNDRYVTEAQAGEDVQFDGEKAFVLVDEPRLYNVFSEKNGRFVLKLVVPGESFTFNAFTFG